MPRPRKCRTVREEMPVRFFKPQGVPMHELQGLVLPLDGLEALRLADAEGLEHVAAAELMGISRPTFSRLLASARTTVATALSRGRAIRVESGAVALAAPGDDETGCGRGLRRRRGHRVGGGGVTAPPEMVSFDEIQEDEMPNRDGSGPHRGRGEGGCGGGQRGRGRGFGGGRFGGSSTVMPVEERAAPPVVDLGLVAVSAHGEGLMAEVDPRFGRAAGFVLSDAAGTVAGYIDNGAGGAMGQGAGLAAAEAVARAGVRTLLTGQVGPKAAAALAAAGVRVVEGCAGMTVAEALCKAASA